MHHVSKCTSCHKAIVVITWRVHCFYVNTYIYIYNKYIYIYIYIKYIYTYSYTYTYIHTYIYIYIYIEREREREREVLLSRRHCFYSAPTSFPCFSLLSTIAVQRRIFSVILDLQCCVHPLRKTL